MQVMSIGMCAGSERVKRNWDIAFEMTIPSKRKENETTALQHLFLALPCHLSKNPEFRFRFSFAWISLHFTNSLTQFRLSNTYA